MAKTEAAPHEGRGEQLESPNICKIARRPQLLVTCCFSKGVIAQSPHSSAAYGRNLLKVGIEGFWYEWTGIQAGPKLSSEEIFSLLRPV